MQKESVVSSRPDRELRKEVITPGDFNVVPYEDSRCSVKITDITCKNASGPCEIEPESYIFSDGFDGNVLIGDSDCFLDKDFELILQQMCCGETCVATMVYRNGEGVFVKEISCKIELCDVTEEQLISDWGMDRLYEGAVHHKTRGVELVKEKRIVDAFRRFNKSLKMLIATEPLDPETVSEKTVNEMMDLKVKLYNNLAHCQLQFNEYSAALDLVNKTLKLDPQNDKALYRRCLAYSGLNMYEEAWKDIQHVLTLDPENKAAQQKANTLKPIIEKINNDYANVIKKMFV
ncbi:unnamed protein product [Arctia plantaginis]|uniref:BDBT FKBP like N-terminal domain-containing protein n=1 Tax=Arctia plantaginis TaxID=874455 RepID=A0A8S1AS42_ARCPL|nr:unnamed protein product [Arctia plantaginis]